MQDTYKIITNPELKTKEELRDGIIELNEYLLTAIDLRDRISITRIKREINLVMRHYIKTNYKK